MREATYRSWAEISQSALRHNVRVLRERLPHGVRVMGVVKANAYGHGLDLVAPTLAGEVEIFGVANLAEALELRALLPHAEILLLGPALPEEREEIVRQGFVPSLSNLAEGEAFSALARRLGRQTQVHLVIDTGMGRIGIWQEEAPALAAALRQLPGLELTGLASHLPVADEDDAFTREQLARFAALATRLRAEGFPPCTLHIENSAGALGFPQDAGDLIRAGLALYGSAPLPEWQARLRPVMTWKTRITLVRDVGAGRGLSYGRTFITPHAMRVATLAVGYADGFRRHLTARDAAVLIGGKRCVLLGRVTMDQILVDLSELPEVQAGDEAVLLGAQGAEQILASEMAERAGTIAWDIFTGIGQRVQRIAVA